MQSHHSVEAFRAGLAGMGLSQVHPLLEEAGLDTEAAFANMFMEDNVSAATWKAALAILLPGELESLAPKMRALFTECKAKVDAMAKLGAKGEERVQRLPSLEAHACIRVAEQAAPLNPRDPEERPGMSGVNLLFQMAQGLLEYPALMLFPTAAEDLRCQGRREKPKVVIRDYWGLRTAMTRRGLCLEAVGLATAKAHWALMDLLVQAMRKTTFEETCKRPTLQQAMRADKFIWLNLREWHVEGPGSEGGLPAIPLGCVIRQDRNRPGPPPNLAAHPDV